MREIALFSTWNKEGISSLARAFESKGYEIVATGNTRGQLENDGIKVKDISELTGEPERFGGRLKTLHHTVLGGILFRPGQDEKEWPYDFRVAAVVCNFYPFEEKAQSIETLDALTDWIDIGGPTMVRAAAKNFKNVWVFTRQEQFARFIVSTQEELPRLRDRLALEAFEEVAKLDESITFEFHMKQPWANIGGKLKYGENPHQKATFLPNRKAALKVYGGLSYNNIRDAEAALRFVSQFKGPACSVVKHQTLCGGAAGLANTKPDQVFHWAWEGDPVSRFGGVIAFNFIPTAKIKETLQTKFIELLVMPRTPESEKWVDGFRSEKDRVKVVLVDPVLCHPSDTPNVEIHHGMLGKLVQSTDSIETTGVDRSIEKLKYAFGQWAAACSKSNAMVLAGGDEGVAFLAGAGQGQPNRVDALSLLAIPRAKDFSKRMNVAMGEMTCFSDAFLPFPDVLDVLKEAGVMKLVQPGGSKSDEQVADRALKLGIEMKISEARHFWH